MQKQNNPFEYSFFQSRLAFLHLNIYVIFFILVIKIFHISIINGNKNYEKSENNFLRNRHLEPVRGIICDRNGKALAVNRHNYAINMTKFRIPIETVFDTIDEVSRITKKEIRIDKSWVKKRARWLPILLLKDLDFDDVVPVYERLHLLPGVSVVDTYERYYPYGNKTASIVGYVSTINPEELESYSEKGYTGLSRIGKAGVEKQYEEILHGKRGEDVVIHDARGRQMEIVENSPPVPGENLRLTIDIDLQEAAVEALGLYKGAVIAADPRSGEIYAMYSYPDFDPNNLSKQGNVFTNKVTREYYAPGSTFKPVTSIAALENGIPASKIVSCDSYYRLGSKSVFRCDYRPGHGGLDLEEALKVSCNIYFYTLADKLGCEKMLSYTWKMGFGEKTGIDIPGERRGFVPAAAKNAMYPGEVVILGIGQGRINVTPIQVLRLYFALANSGKMATPHLFLQNDETAFTSPEVKEYINNIYKSLSDMYETGVNPDALNKVRKGLYRVVNEEGGTARRVNFNTEWQAAGKTGTAENWRGKDPDAWFACWAPYDNAEIVVVSIVENAGHGADFAAPIAKAVLAKYFEKKKNQQALLTGNTKDADSKTSGTKSIDKATSAPAEKR